MNKNWICRTGNRKSPGLMEKIGDLFGLFKPKRKRSAESKAKQSTGMKRAWARRKTALLEAKRLVGD